MDAPVHDLNVATLVDILATAMDEYRAAFAEIAEEIDQGRAATPQQLERAMNATLRLENAQTLFDLSPYGWRDRDETPPPRRLH